MKIPKYVEAMIEKRKRDAISLWFSDKQLCEWLDRYGIETEDYDTRGGVEMYSAPEASANRIRKAIENHEN